MPVSEKMIAAAQHSACSSSAFHADEISQACMNAAWNIFDAEDKTTWPDGEGYEYQCLVRGWKGKMIVGKAFQIDKWDHVLAYLEPDHIMPDLDKLFVPQQPEKD